jgi:rare lipoprotein A
MEWIGAKLPRCRRGPDALANPAYSAFQLLTLIGAAVVVAACGTAPKQAGGGYYQDDGPPPKPPETIGREPEVVVKDEPFHKFANRPYTVFGQTYVPVVNKQRSKERGLASWYGKKFHGQKTASGEVYDMFALTAAHKTLPIPSYARVTNVKNGKAVVVRINDRGPFHPGRVIDLSYAAAARIGLLETGSALVEVERLLPGATDETLGTTTSASTEPKVQTPMVEREETGLWLQVGAFATAEAADLFREKLARDMPWMMEPAQVVFRDGLHRVRLGPYRNSDEATAIGEKVRRSMGVAPVLVIR